MLELADLAKIVKLIGPLTVFFLSVLMCCVVEVKIEVRNVLSARGLVSSDMRVDL